MDLGTSKLCGSKTSFWTAVSYLGSEETNKDLDDLWVPSVLRVCDVYNQSPFVFMNRTFLASRSVVLIVPRWLGMPSDISCYRWTLLEHRSWEAVDQVLVVIGRIFK